MCSIMKEGEPILDNDSEKKEPCQKASWNLTFAASVAVIGSSFQFGYNTGVINAPELVIEQFYNQTYFTRYNTFMEKTQLKVLWAVTVSIFALGGMVGSFMAGYLADHLGRKKGFLVNNLLVGVGVVLMATSKVTTSYEMLIAGRFVTGINSGINTGLAPLYLTEIAPMKYRGILGTFNQLGIVGAILISQLLGLPLVLGNADRWPILLAVPILFSVYQIIGLYFCPDSPAYLSKKGNEKECIEALQWLRNSSNVSQDINDIKQQQNAAAEVQTTGIVEIFKTPSLLRPMIIAIVMQLSQQFSGINAVFYYSTSLFVNAGVPESQSTYATVGMGVANVVMTGVSIALIEHAGRRILQLVGIGGMCICSILLAVTLNVIGVTWVSWSSVVLVFIFVIFFQVGPGPIPWFITAELFNEAARPAAISVAGLVNWTGNFVIGLAYPPLELLIHGYTFVIFAIFLLVFGLFTYFNVPETKGKSISEISQHFVTNKL